MHLRAVALIVLIVLVSWKLKGQHVDDFKTRVTTPLGTLEGLYSTKTQVRRFLGVPFAQPPVGELRWRAPRPVEAWDGVRDATEFGPRAVQRFIFDDMRFRSAGVSEDCLYLNVWTPARSRGDESLPVLFYIHGGGNVGGSGDELRYDGEALAREGIVVVTVNYRLGIFGFLSHPELSAEAEYGGSGNYGHLDQVEALQWVRDNISAFGGDPNRVTIAGESAGSMAVSNHLVSPLSRGLFAGAVGQSGATISPTQTVVSLAEAEAKGQEWVEAFGAENLAELRAAPLEELYEFQNKLLPDGPDGLPQGYPLPVLAVNDGHFLTGKIPAIYEAGEAADVPLMVGWTSTESSWGQAKKRADWLADLAETQPTRVNALVKFYGDLPNDRAQAELASDGWITYGTWRWSELHHAAGSPVFRYRFDRIRPPLVGEKRTREPVGAGHATDIEYFLGTLDKSDAYAWTMKDRMTSAAMVTYLVNFVKYGDPDPRPDPLNFADPDLPDWPALDAAARPVMHLNVMPELRESTVEERYRYWQTEYEK